MFQISSSSEVAIMDMRTGKFFQANTQNRVPYTQG